MTATWQNLIQTSSTHVIAHDSLDATACFMPLTQLGVLTVSGADSQTFLQSLLTNDIAQLNLHESQYSGFCTPKGRLLALFFIIRSEASTYQLVLPKDLCEAMTKRLGMYVLRSKVTVTNASDNVVCAGATLRQPELPADITYHPIATNIQRGLIICPTDKADELCTSLIEQQFQAQATAYWLYRDITDGIASVVTETQEKFTPQQLNLDITNAVNFQKGCYPGQEVVARLHYLGKASRRMFTAEFSGTTLPENGCEILTDEGKVAGHIVSAQQQNEHSIVCLISLKLSEFDANLIFSDSPVRLTSELVDK
tara:strand:+ start:318 stop:1250 length:933 start_codon:yes stop_codon:yes gene_type:complete